ncbi:nitroreductase family protein [Glycomyces sp. TRM65418]|uniref:nitroreductase family protein n=1 Tax=Glycomyces sp. TRM65418 TaxID=2867006 RepID=UPI001CE6A7AA|nr:nitroreductase family protein [Glycomyces sp. TRM65418]MCC3763614.1 nitroreductase family protein [Glycomyces sp. TRM65418]QZD57596.1 nitroreductase family protein [Glycomyces sp. TRM65418]
MTATADRHAQTAVPIHPLLASRHSTRAFAPDVDLTDAQVTALLEAARWAPSSGNTQPWRFLLAKRDTGEFKRVVDCLNPGNREWASHASALLVAVRTEANERGPLGHAMYDLGQAMAHLTFQAAAEGLTVRQMAGFDAAALAAEFALPETLVPTAVAAIGVPGDPAALAESVAGPDRAPRARLAIEDLLIKP